MEKWDVAADEEEHIAANTSVGSAMDVDAPADGATEDQELSAPDPEDGGEEEEEEEEEEEDEEDSSDVAMVPVADLLNARYGSENVSIPS